MAGVDPAALSLDLYKPVLRDSCGPAPIVVYVHGGGFSIGDKSQTVADKAEFFTAAGWFFVSVNYRLSSISPSDESVRYPAHAEDVAAAVAWLVSNAEAWDGDPSRLVLMGHSAGAFLVSLLATDVSFFRAAGVDEDAIRCVVSLDARYNIPDIMEQGGPGESVYLNAFGSDPDTWVRASPLTHATESATSAQFLIVTQGAPRRIDDAERFAAALRAGGTSASVLDVSPLSHELLNEAVGNPNDGVVTPTIATFLSECVPSTT